MLQLDNVSAAADIETPTLLGSYQVLEKIGTAGFKDPAARLQSAEGFRAAFPRTWLLPRKRA